MKKIYLSFLAVVLFTFTAGGQNLVLNPGFELWDDANTPTDWTHVESVDQESVEVHSGSYSAKHTGGTTDLGQTIPVTAGSTYNLSLWYKVIPGDGTDARIWSYWRNGGTNLNDNADELRGPSNGYLPNSTEWQEYSAVITAPETATDLYLEVRTYSGAVTYWDDFLLEEVTLPEDTDPPVWGTGFPAVIPSHQRVGFALVANLDEPGVVSYIVVPAGSTAPSVAEVIAGVDYGTVTVTTAGTIIVPVADTNVPHLVSDVDEDSDYDVYLVAADDEAVPNVQDAVVMLEVSTVPEPTVLMYAGFDSDLTPFTPVSVTGDQVWAWGSSGGNGFAKISGYVSGTSYVNEDWLISPAVNLDAATGEYLSFETANNYGDANTTLKVNISSDFSGVYDAAAIAAATWTDITPAVNLSPGGSWNFVFSGELDFSILPGGTGYLAFVYECTDNNAGTWEIDNVLYTGYPVAGYDPTVSSDIYAVDDVAETITGVLYKSSLADFTANLTPASGATFEVYEADGTTVATDIQTGYKVIVTAGDGITTKTYTVTVDDGMPGGLFFSEYIEGSSNNKALEIFNPNDQPVRLDYYRIIQSTNGNGWQYYHVFPAGAVLDPGDVWVIITDQTDPALFDPAGADEVMPYPSVVHHTGDDARGLIIVTSEDTTFVDIIGIPDEDPGTGWTVAGVANATAEHTLVRKNYILEGTTDWALSAGTDAASSQWLVYPQNFFDSLGVHTYFSSVPSDDATISSAVYTVDNDLETITEVPQTEDLATFRANLTPAAGATFEVYEADGTTVATDLQSDYKVIVTAEDGVTTKTYTITKQEVSDDATVSSLVYTVDDVAETITGVLYKSSLAAFTANLTPASGATFEVYEADGTTVATDIQTGYKVIVTAGDGITTKTYTITVDDSMPGGLFFSEYIEGSSNNKALEIFNPNDEPVRLDYYQIIQSSNGNGWQYYHIFPAGAVLDPGDVWVIITDQTDPALFDPAGADEVMAYPSVVHHNGDDARGLIIVTSEDTTFVDIIGIPDEDPGTGWTVAGVANATAEHTLVRKNYILEGTTDWALSAGTDAASSQWLIYPQNFFDSLGIHTYSSFVPSDDATVSSAVYTVDDVLETITGVLATEDLATFRANLTPAAGATFEVYEADGTTVATDLQSDYKVIVTAEDGVTTKTYTITKQEVSDDATVSSLVYTVDDVAETITGVLYKSSLADFTANLTPASGATFEVYEADGTTVATDIQTGYKVIVTAEDGTTTKTYTVTVEDSMPEELFFSEYIEGSSNNKALEVYNPNDHPVRLDYYQIAQSVNGGGWQYYHIFPAGAVLDPGDVWVIITNQTDPALFDPSGADEVLAYPSVVHHNGDDARGLIIVTSEDTTFVDIIGVPDEDPGTAWDVAGVANATAEHTLVRKPSVVKGNTNWAASAGTNADNSEWFVLEQNVFDSLGAHLMTGPELSHDATISDLLVNGNSIPGFTPAQITYSYTLEAGTTELPMVTAVTNNENAVVTVTGPVNLDGTEEERTATVLITAEDGVTTKTYYVLFDVAVGLDQNKTDQIRIYPVPALNYLNIANTRSAESISVLNVTGSVVKIVELAGEPSVRLDLTDFSSGVYFLKIKTAGSVEVIRFIKE